jgi:hypothetical protein
VGAQEQLVVERGASRRVEVDDAAARRSLRAQISRLERERSRLIAGAFPHVHPRALDGGAHTGALAAGPLPGHGGPRLLDLGALERLRDALAGELQRVRGEVRERGEREREARELLARMTLEPGRYKFARLPVRDLGEGICGTWEVRPRFGIIGMLAGWWELKLSSGCPLARGPRPGAAP